VKEATIKASRSLLGTFGILEGKDIISGRGEKGDYGFRPIYRPPR
jgi:hypothetical protein